MCFFNVFSPMLYSIFTVCLLFLKNFKYLTLALSNTSLLLESVVNLYCTNLVFVNGWFDSLAFMYFRLLSSFTVYLLVFNSKFTSRKLITFWVFALVTAVIFRSWFLKNFSSSFLDLSIFLGSSFIALSHCHPHKALCCWAQIDILIVTYSRYFMCLCRIIFPRSNVKFIINSFSPYISAVIQHGFLGLSDYSYFLLAKCEIVFILVCCIH